MSELAIIERDAREMGEASLVETECACGQAVWVPAGEEGEPVCARCELEAGR